MRDIRKITTRALTALAFAALAIVLTGRSTRLQAKISVLEGRNQELQRMNKALEAQADRIRDSLDAESENTRRLRAKEAELERQTAALDSQIKSIKSKYEKARNRAAGFDADSIRRFFSELQ